MNPEDYEMKKPNKQGYRVLTGKSVHTCNDDKCVYEWALIDRGEGKSYCVAHWLFVEEFGEWTWEMEGLSWRWGHYFDTLEEAEVYYLEQVTKEIQNEIWDLQDWLKFYNERLSEARLKLPEEEEY